MAIDWFPGHMVAARKNAAETMRKTDVVIEVLDARVPLASRSPMVEELRRENQRPALKLLNKADLADPARTAAWIAWYNAQPNTKAIAVTAQKAGDVQRIPRAAQELAPTRTTALKPLRLMILGIPNVGKSTLMNALLKRKVAKVGDEPAITKMQARHALSPTSYIVDTPGMMWPGVDQHVAHLLAATHSIGRNAYDDHDVALFLAELLLTHYRARLDERYGALPPDADGHALLAHIARVRSIVRDVAPLAALTFLKDFRNGLFGRITLEVPPAAERA